MKSHLSRPLLAVVVSGAFLAGGGLFAAPAFAEPPASPTTTESPVPPPATTAPVTTPPTTELPPPFPEDPSDDPTTTAPTSEPPVTETTPTPGPSDSTDPDDPTTPPTTTAPPPVDKTAPQGAFTPNRWSIYPGQSVTLALIGIKDNVSTPAQIKRVVTWGDGSSSTVSPTATSVAHTYKSSGKKPITLTLTDAAGNKKVVKSAGPTVVPQAVKYKLSRTSVFHGQKFVWELLSVPAGATKITVAWGDGRATVITKPKKQKITRYYYVTPTNELVSKGTKTLKATVYNKYGAATPQVVGKVTLKPDTSRPVVRVTPPSKPSKASSWKSIKGTATDTGSGIKEMYLMALVQKNNGAIVCYSNSKKKWINAEVDVVPCVNAVKPSKGKYSLALKVAPPKGYMGIAAAAGDWADNLNWAADPNSANPFIYERVLN